MELSKLITDKVCYLYNEVGDYDMLLYLYRLGIDNDVVKSLINTMLSLNEFELDTTFYCDFRRIFLNYLGFYHNEDSGLLEYKGN